MSSMKSKSTEAMPVVQKRVNGVDLANDERFRFESTPESRWLRWLTNRETLALLFNGPPSPALACGQFAALTVPVLVMGSEFVRPYFRQSNEKLA